MRMPVVYHAEFQYTEDRKELTLTSTLPDGTKDTSPVDTNIINQLEEQCCTFTWNEKPHLSAMSHKP